jgi:hypothetical protein
VRLTVTVWLSVKNETGAGDRAAVKMRLVAKGIVRVDNELTIAVGAKQLTMRVGRCSTVGRLRRGMRTARIVRTSDGHSQRPFSGSVSPVQPISRFEPDPGSGKR